MKSNQLFERLSFQVGGKQFDGRQVAIGIGLGLIATSLYGLRKYFEGGWCYLDKDLAGKNIVITGANTGIGKETALRLAQLNANIFMGARDQKKNRQTVDQLRQMGKGRIQSFKLDLAVRDSIQNFAKDVKLSLGNQPLHYLINNAGVMAIQTYQLTNMNLEMQIGTNHFGHFYLTYLLWEKLKLSGHPRIVNVSARAHRSLTKNFDLDFNNLYFQNGNYHPIAAYSRSKKANILFTKQLQKKMTESGVNGTVVSLHPGVIKTELIRYVSASWLFKIMNILFYPLFAFCEKNKTQGAQTTLYCVLEDHQKLVKGAYYSDCKLARLQSPQVDNPVLAKQLWEESEKVYGIKFNV